MACALVPVQPTKLLTQLLSFASMAGVKMEVLPIMDSLNPHSTQGEKFENHRHKELLGTSLFH